jgi:hypothetical protein
MPDLIDNVYSQLIDAHERQPAVPATQHTGRSRLGSRLRSRSRRWFGIVAISTVALGSAAALAATSLAPPPSRTPPDAGAPSALSPSAAAVASLGILKRKGDSADPVPSEYLPSFSGYSGANPELARDAHGLAGSVAWVVPGRGSICLVANSTSHPYLAGPLARTKALSSQEGCMSRPATGGPPASSTSPGSSPTRSAR